MDKLAANIEKNKVSHIYSQLNFCLVFDTLQDKNSQALRERERGLKFVIILNYESYMQDERLDLSRR